MTSSQMLSDGEEMNVEIYRSKIEKEHTSSPQDGMRLFPHAFDTKLSSGGAFFRDRSWEWGSLEGHLSTLNACGVLMRLPLFWQVEPLVFQVCKKTDSYLFLNDVANMPVGKVAIQNANCNTVLTTANDAVAFSDYLNGHNFNIATSWIVVHKIDSFDKEAANVLYAGAEYSAHEIHIAPGIPLFVQCPFLARNSNLTFHIDDAFVFESFDGGEITITGTEIDALPASNLKLNQMWNRSGEKCACGREILSPK